MSRRTYKNVAKGVRSDDPLPIKAEKPSSVSNRVVVTRSNRVSASGKKRCDRGNK